jgi:NADPH-dependent glutamate synthase beta subunit-like oxidoreductase
MEDRLGGALWLVPNYRLPEDVLKTTLDNLVRIAGIDVKYNSMVGEGRLTIERLKNEGYKAIFLAKGTPQPRAITFEGNPVEGQDLSGVMFGHTFLYEVSHGNLDTDYFNGKKVVIIGGGNVAFDAARTARRLGGEVTIVALESADKDSVDAIPADQEEIRAAWEEGIQIVHSRGVQQIVGDHGRFKGINCPKCTAVFDDHGFNPQFDCTDCIDIEGDILIITVGQMADRASLEKEDLLDERGRLAVDPFTLQSLRNPSIFIGGDIRKVGFMIEAMHEGIEAAESMHRYLRGMDIREGRKREYEKFDLPHRDEYVPAPEVIWIPPEKRMHFKMFEQGLTLKEAIDEAKRCLTCGPCVSCKACVSIGFEKSLYAVDVNEDVCSGCGVCVYACNYDSAQLIEKEGKMVSRTDIYRCKSCGLCVAACPSNARTMVDDATYDRISEVYANLEK